MSVEPEAAALLAELTQAVRKFSVEQKHRITDTIGTGKVNSPKGMWTMTPGD